MSIRERDENTKLAQQNALLKLYPNQKIKVFISSICGVEKYDKVRAELKKYLEATQLVRVYTFEDEGASTLLAGDHYILALKDSDVCIFLIDKKDDISQGVQKELDTVKKHNIKALYYFCDEFEEEITPLENSLMGAQYAKSKTIHSFSELSKNGAKDLIEDIAMIYHYYCRHEIDVISNERETVQEVDITSAEKYQLSTIPKIVLKSVDKCRDYILGFIYNDFESTFANKEEKSNEIDEWGLEFLQILFERKSIKTFNTALYLNVLKEIQNENLYQIVEIRWKAIQEYFQGDVKKCIKYLNEALKKAKETKQYTWIIKDILIDLRNMNWIYCTEKNISHLDSSAQKELIESDEELYYPIIDRIKASLNEKYIDGLYKEKTKSPYSVTIGNDLNQYGEMLASLVVVSMYNGSLTHIFLIYEYIRKFTFYLTCKSDKWNLKFTLYKLSIFSGKEKEIKRIENSYSEVLYELSPEEAKSIMEFCSNHPIQYERLNSQLLAFASVGYFLDDKVYKQYENFIIEEITEWLSNDKLVFSIGKNIFKCLNGVAYRMSQDTLSEICCQFIDKNFTCWYIDIFKLIKNHINLQKMSIDSATALVEYINCVFDSEKGREKIKYNPFFLCMLRKQNRDITEKMDKKIADYLPDFYQETYKLETTQNEKQDLLEFVKIYTDRVMKTNKIQGKDGIYFEHADREIAIIRNILLEKEFINEAETMDLLISTMVDILFSKEDFAIKLDAIALLICIVVKYPEDYKRNQNLYENLYKQQECIEAFDYLISSSNIDQITLKIGLLLLFISMEKEVYDDFLELLTNIQGDNRTIISVTELIVGYLDDSDEVRLPSRVESVILMSVLQWLQSDDTDIKWNATRILLAMSRNPENYNVVSHQLIKLINSCGANIKCLILRYIYKIKSISDDTRKYIIFKCKNDANFVIRMICNEVEEGI